MKSLFDMRVPILSLLMFVVAIPLCAKEGWKSEKLLRNVVVVPQSSSSTSYLISWRMLDSDDEFTTFDILKDGKLFKTDLNIATCYIDAQGNSASRYQVVTKRNGEPIDTTKEVSAWKDVFMKLQLDRPSEGTFHDVTYTYSPNDCSVADVDGDGEYEIVVKWQPSAEADNAHGGFTGPTIFDCYKFDGTKLWRIDMGHNIRSGAHYVPFLFYDFNGDGRAEFIVKTGPGTKDGVGRYVTEVATEAVIRGTDNEKEYLNAGGQVMYGPEFLTVFDGLTGKSIHTVYYNPNRACFVGGAPESRTDIWGDDYGNRSERYLAAVAHLDNSQDKASAVMCRGYYTRSYLWAVDFDGIHLTTRWRHASLSGNTVMKTDGQNEKDVSVHHSATYPSATNHTAYGQGNHNLSVGDVDNDGKDEIIYGSSAIDHDGNLLWSTGLGHGDALHLGDLMPDRPGLEVFQIHENPPFGVHISDAATGELLIHHTGSGDCARGMAADAMEKRGYEFWNFGDANMYNVNNTVVGSSMSFNFRVYWDGDVYDELIGDIGNHNQPFLEKYGVGRLTVANKQLYEHGYNVSCNGTKGSPCLVADIFGDWREEIILFNNEDKQTLNIFSTSEPGTVRVPCLMTDHVYRMAIAWQNSGYNQPPHLSYYLPDSTMACFFYEDESLKKQVISMGDSLQRIKIRYKNCTSVSFGNFIRLTDETTSRRPKGISIKKNPKLCNVEIYGEIASTGEWAIVLSSTNSSNGIVVNDTIHLVVKDETGITEVEREFSGDSNSLIFDVYGRNTRMKNPALLPRGIYIQGGKKLLVK